MYVIATIISAEIIKQSKVKTQNQWKNTEKKYNEINQSDQKYLSNL